MSEQHGREPYREPPEAGVGSEGPSFDPTVLASTTDAEIEQAIHDALYLDPDVDSANFDIEVESGVAKLAGRARSLDERRRAVEVAGRVHGVRRVVDRLKDDTHQAGV